MRARCLSLGMAGRCCPEIDVVIGVEVSPLSVPCRVRLFPEACMPVRAGFSLIPFQPVVRQLRTRRLLLLSENSKLPGAAPALPGWLTRDLPSSHK